MRRMNALFDALRASPLYSMPLYSAQEEGGGAAASNSVIAFKFAGNWYVSLKHGESVSANPDDWSLVVADPAGDWNFRYYCAPQGRAGLSEKLADALQAIANGLNVKRLAGTLEPAESPLTEEQKQHVVLAKEKEGSGLIPGNVEPLDRFMRDYGMDVFRTDYAEEQVARRAGAQQDNTLDERLLLKRATGDPFRIVPHGGVMGLACGNPQPRVFYAFNASAPATGLDADTDPPLRRIQVGFDEMLEANGRRSYRPRVVESSARLSTVMNEIGEGNTIINGPEGLAAYLKGDAEGLMRYARHNLAAEFDDLEAQMRLSREKEGDDYASPTCGNFGEEVEGAHVTSQAWYRVLRDSDYVPENMPEAKGEGLVEAPLRVLDRNRADYFLVREHPDYRRRGCRAESPRYEVLFFNGAPDGGIPASFEEVTYKDAAAVCEALRERGIRDDSRLIKLGEEEYAVFFNERGVGEHVNDVRVWLQTKEIGHSPMMEGGDVHPKTTLSEDVRERRSGATRITALFPEALSCRG